MVLSAKSRQAAALAAQERTGHALFAPSASARWLECPASIQATLAAGFDTISDEWESADSGDTFYSVEGTLAHHIAEAHLRDGAPVNRFLGDVYGVAGRMATVDEIFLAHVDVYVRWCEDRGPAFFRAIEKRVDLSPWFPIPGQGGTADFVHYSTIDHRLTIGDLKFGAGVKVFAQENTQLMLYALGVRAELRAKGHNPRIYTVAIIQPRKDDHIDEWQFGNDTLDEFEIIVRRQAAAAWGDNPPYNPTPKGCRFCPVKTSCRALAQHTVDLVDASFDDLTSKAFDPIDASSEHLSKLLHWRRTIYSVMSAAETELTRRVRDGEKVDGWKLVQGRQTRAWKDPSAVVDVLETVFGVPAEDLHTTELKSPKAVEDLIASRRLGRRKSLAPLIRKVDGPVTIAPAWDERLDLGDVAEAFDDLTDSDDL